MGSATRTSETIAVNLTTELQRCRNGEGRLAMRPSSVEDRDPRPDVRVSGRCKRRASLACFGGVAAAYDHVGMQEALQVPGIGIDVVATDIDDPHRLSAHIGSIYEIEQFGVVGVLAAKEAATKVIGGQPRGTDLKDVHVSVATPNLLDRDVLDLLGELETEFGNATYWRFELDPPLDTAVGEAGGCSSGFGILAHTDYGQVAVCLGQHKGESE